MVKRIQATSFKGCGPPGDNGREMRPAQNRCGKNAPSTEPTWRKCAQHRTWHGANAPNTGLAWRKRAPVQNPRGENAPSTGQARRKATGKCRWYLTFFARRLNFFARRLIKSSPLFAINAMPHILHLDFSFLLRMPVSWGHCGHWGGDAIGIRRLIKRQNIVSPV